MQKKAKLTRNVFARPPKVDACSNRSQALRSSINAAEATLEFGQRVTTDASMA
jgi:hypothetical protein